MNGATVVGCILTLGLEAFAGGAAAQSRSGASNAEQNYVLHCRGCHGAGGDGVPGRVPAVRGSLAGFMRADVGRDFVMRVPGAANSALSAPALAAVLNWMASTFAADELAPDAAFFNAREISAARARPLLGVRSTRRTVVRQLAARGISVAEDY